MRLAHQLALFEAQFLKLSYDEIKNAIRERRFAIRYHRDQKMDDRCWLDDFLVWEMLEDTPPFEMPGFDEGMRQCKLYYQFRRSDSLIEPRSDAIHDQLLWDLDIQRIGLSYLFGELHKIQKGIKRHRDILGQRTVKDDMDLYMVLPERLFADFRLPPREDFLGSAKAPCAGCPSFWKSHEQCDKKTCNVHQWGPCK